MALFSESAFQILYTVQNLAVAKTKNRTRKSKIRLPNYRKMVIDNKLWERIK